MPDTRTHRGPHPADAALFAPERWPVLRQAVAEYSWLLTRGYAASAALKLVGDRHQLAQRQRLAVMRSSCSDQALEQRLARQLTREGLRGAVLHIDGFNLLTTVEAALAGGVLLRGRDGCLRDLASVHGSYRKVEETRPALELIGTTLAALDCGETRWFLDRPVSNSARLAALIRELALHRGWSWQVELVPDADRAVTDADQAVADADRAVPDADRAVPDGPAVAVSADSVVLDRCREWFNLAREVIEQSVPDVWLVSMGTTAPET